MSACDGGRPAKQDIGSGPTPVGMPVGRRTKKSPFRVPSATSSSSKTPTVITLVAVVLLTGATYLWIHRSPEVPPAPLVVDPAVVTAPEKPLADSAKPVAKPAAHGKKHRK